MKSIILKDDHDLCIRTFLKELDSLGVTSNRRGVLHVGAHMGEEVQAYRDHSYDPIYLAEGNPEILPRLTQKFLNDEDVFIIPSAVGDRKGFAEFIVHRTKSGSMESSGLLELDQLGRIVPTFDSERRHRVPLTTIDSIMESKVLREKIGLMVLDIQGTEHQALCGAEMSLNGLDAIICEVNILSNYEGCALEPEIDKILTAAKFVKRLSIYHELYDISGKFPAWGECLWTR